MKINSYIHKITRLINEFSLNVVVANVYEIYNLFNSYLDKEISNKSLKSNIIKLMMILIPFTPHLAFEILENFGIKSSYSWPKIDDRLIKEEKINIVVQINGKTRTIIEIKKDLNEKSVMILCEKNLKIKDKVLKSNIKK